MKAKQRKGRADAKRTDWTRGIKLERASDGQPLFAQLRDGIRRLILDGSLRPGEALMPQRQLCKTFKINQVTTTQAVGELLREGLLRSEHGRGLFVNDLTPPLITVVYPRSRQRLKHDGLYEVMLNAALGVLGSEAVRIGYCTRERPEQGSRFGPPLEDVLGTNASLFLTVGIQNEEYLGALAATGKPVVAMDAAPTSVNFDGVVFDTFRDGYLCTRRLLEAGHQRIVFLGHDRGLHPGDPSGRIRIPEPDTIRRQAGFQYAMQQAGMPLSADSIIAVLPKHGHEAAALARELPAKGCTAAVADHHGASWLAQYVNIPQDLSIALTGNVPLEPSGAGAPLWSGTYLDPRALGLAAGAQILRRLRGPVSPHGALIVLPPTLVEGATVRIIGPRPALYEYLTQEAERVRGAKP